jgi:hypothetical protein
MDKEIFKDLGFTEIETRVYLALLELGQAHTGAIIKKTGLHKATIYQILNRLQEKGIVSYTLERDVKAFQATDPKNILDQFQEKEDNFKKLLPELQSIAKFSRKQSSAEIFNGKKGIITVYRDILSHKDYFHLGAGIPILETIGPFFYEIQKIKKKRKIKAKLLISEKHRGTSFAKSIGGEIKFLPREFEGPVNTVIYGNKIAIISWSDLTAFVLESKDTNKAYKKYFEALWKIAKS